MSRAGDGTFTFPANSRGVPNATIESAKYNAVLDEAEEGLSDSINKDGTLAFAADQSMGGNKLTSLGAPSARDNAARALDTMTTALAQGTAGGTVNAITLTFSPTFAAYTTGTMIRWISAGANTSTVTVAVDGLTAKNLNKLNNVALTPGDTGPSGYVCLAVYDGSRFLLINPYSAYNRYEIVKSANETVTTSTTLQADDELLFPMAANTKYFAKWTIFYSTPAAADFKWRIDSSAATDPTPVNVTSVYTDPTGAVGGTSNSALSGMSNVIPASGGTEGMLVVTAYVDNGADAGNLRFSWAQSSSSGTTTVRRGSLLEYRVV